MPRPLALPTLDSSFGELSDDNDIEIPMCTSPPSPITKSQRNKKQNDLMLADLDLNDPMLSISLPAPLFGLAVKFNEFDWSSNVSLGAGSSGQVSSVLHIPTQTRLAVKQIRLGEAGQRDLIQRELATMRITNCPNIVQYLGSFVDGDCLMVTMELMTGSLANLISTKGPLPEHIAWSILKQSLLGLEYLHSNLHRIHRDVKPSNILFHRSGYVKLADFGISTVLASAALASTFVGTVVYMSPERLSGLSYSYNCDVWGLGLTMYEALTATSPYPQRTQGFWAILNEASQRPPQLSSSLPISEVLRRLVNSCIEIEPERRPNAKELLLQCTNDLNECVQTFHQWIGSTPTKTIVKGSILPKKAEDIIENHDIGDNVNIHECKTNDKNIKRKPSMHRSRARLPSAPVNTLLWSPSNSPTYLPSLTPQPRLVSALCSPTASSPTLPPISRPKSGPLSNIRKKPIRAVAAVRHRQRFL